MLRKQHHSLSCLVLIDIGQIVIKIFSPKSSFFVLVVEDTYTSITQDICKCLSVGAVFSSVRDRDIVLVMLVLHISPLLDRDVTYTTHLFKLAVACLPYNTRFFLLCSLFSIDTIIFHPHNKRSKRWVVYSLISEPNR